MQVFIRVFIFIMLVTSVLEAAVGKITAISGNASLERGSSILSATLGASLESKDSIVTTKEAKAQLTFTDNTIITVGKQSRFSVEEYLFDATPNSSTKFNMISGTIRVMSGKIGKIAPEKFAVKTKTATIGIRGTDFIVDALLGGETSILCMQGSIAVYPSNNNYANVLADMVIVPAGSFITIAATGTIGDVQEFTPTKLNTILNKGFVASAVKATPGSVLLDANTPIEFSLDSSLPVMHSDESLDRGAASNIDSFIIDTSNTIIADTIITTIPSVPTLPSDAIAFNGFTSVIYNDLSGQVFAGRGTVALNSIPSTSSVLGSMMINDTTGIPVWTAVDLGITTSYTALDSFSTSIASFTWDPSIYPTYTAYSIPSDATASLTTSADVSGDFFSWGEWVIDPMMFSSTYGGTGQYAAHGYWAAGVQTPVSVIDAYRSALDVIHYTGGIIGEVQMVDASGYSVSTSPITAGFISMIVDFGADTFQSNMEVQTASAGTYMLTYNGSTASNHLIGSLTSGGALTGATGSLQGGFYGPTGNIVGGTFDAASTADLLKIQGAFKAVAP